ncbi:MAG: hypothetical protein HYS12_05695 [Planctomycetes bacterium]|nr:hypothetical protein [Planctomycetota bacterium]
MDKTFTKLGNALADLETAWQDRLADADALLAAGRNAGAIVTGLYALEIRLKVAICKRLDLEQLPKNFEIHDLKALLLLAGWSRRIDRKSARKVKLNWDAIVSRSEELNELRYTADKNWTHAEAATFLKQLKDPPDGVLPWITKLR